MVTLAEVKEYTGDHNITDSTLNRYISHATEVIIAFLGYDPRLKTCVANVLRDFDALQDADRLNNIQLVSVQIISTKCTGPVSDQVTNFSTPDGGNRTFIANNNYDRFLQALTNYRLRQAY